MVGVHFRAVISCILLVLCFNCAIPRSVAVEAESALSLLGLTYLPRVQYDRPVVIVATIAHSRAMIPSATIYYACLSNNTIALGGWKIAEPDAIVSGSDSAVTTYKFLLPYAVYNESFAFGSKIVFYLEATDLKGNSLLTSRPQDRWDPLVQDDKFVVDITDPYPPVILDVERNPISPSSGESVPVTVKVVDQGSGVAEVSITAFAEGHRPQTLEMSYSKTLEINSTKVDVYEGQIPPYESGTEVVFFISATDREGNSITSSKSSYSVLEPLAAELIRNRETLTYLALALGGLAVASTWITLRRRTSRLTAPQLRAAAHPKAMNALFVLTVLSAVWIYYQLSNQMAPLLGLIIAGATVLSWGLVDPRIDILLPVRRDFDASPPAALVVIGYVVGLSSAVAIGLASLFGIYTLPIAHRFAVMLAQDALALVFFGVLLQICWPRLQDLEIAIEIERVDKNPG